MSDSIVSCTVFKHEDGTIQYYEITFAFDGFIVSPKLNPVIVDVSNLINPTDLTDVKAAACAQASVIKALYTNSTTITDLNGTVSL
jgi:hypothetical protein